MVVRLKNSKHNKKIPRPGHSEPSGIRATYLPNRSVQYYHNIHIHVMHSKLGQQQTEQLKQCALKRR